MSTIIVYAANMIVAGLLARFTLRRRAVSVTLLVVIAVQAGALACSLWGPAWGWWALNAAWVLILLLWSRRADPGDPGDGDDGGFGPDDPEDHGVLAFKPARGRYRLVAVWA